MMGARVSASDTRGLDPGLGFAG